MIMASICCVEGFQDRGTPDSSSQSVTSFSSCLRASSLALSSVAEISPVSRRVSCGRTATGGCCRGAVGPAAAVTDAADGRPDRGKPGVLRAAPVTGGGGRLNGNFISEDARAEQGVQGVGAEPRPTRVPGRIGTGIPSTASRTSSAASCRGLVQLLVDLVQALTELASSLRDGPVRLSPCLLSSAVPRPRFLSGPGASRWTRSTARCCTVSGLKCGGLRTHRGGLSRTTQAS